MFLIQMIYVSNRLRVMLSLRDLSSITLMATVYSINKNSNTGDIIFAFVDG